MNCVWFKESRANPLMSAGVWHVPASTVVPGSRELRNSGNHCSSQSQWRGLLASELKKYTGHQNGSTEATKRNALHLTRWLKCRKCTIWNCCYVVVIQQSRAKTILARFITHTTDIHTATYIVEESTIPSNVAADIFSIALYWRFLHAHTCMHTGALWIEHCVLSNILTAHSVLWYWTSGQVTLSIDSVPDY